MTKMWWPRINTKVSSQSKKEELFRNVTELTNLNQRESDGRPFEAFGKEIIACILREIRPLRTPVRRC